MAFIIVAPCVADYSCVEVCPVDCIGPIPNDPSFDQTEQLYIDPRWCIDCGICEKACPVNAIFHEDLLPDKWQHYATVNKDYFAEKGN
jgi:ferredoxin